MIKRKVNYFGECDVLEVLSRYSNWTCINVSLEQADKKYGKYIPVYGLSSLESTMDLASRDDSLNFMVQYIIIEYEFIEGYYIPQYITVRGYKENCDE